MAETLMQNRTPPIRKFHPLVRWPGDPPPPPPSGEGVLSCLGMVVIVFGMVFIASIAQFNTASITLPAIGVITVFVLTLLAGGARRSQTDDAEGDCRTIAGAPAAKAQPFGMRAVMISFTVFSVVTGVASAAGATWLAPVLGLIGAVVSLNASRATQIEPTKPSSDMAD